MTVFAKTDVPLTVGGQIPTQTVGVPGYTHLFTPAGVKGSTWTAEVSGATATVGSAVTIGTRYNTPMVLTGNAPTDVNMSDRVATLNPAPFTTLGTTGWTVQVIVDKLSPTAQIWQIGQYTLPTYVGMWQLTHSGQKTQLAVADPSKPYSVLARIDGTSTKLMAGNASVGAGSITSAAVADYSPMFIGRSTWMPAGSEAGIVRLCIWPRALSDAEMQKAQDTARATYTWLTV